MHVSFESWLSFQGLRRICERLANKEISKYVVVVLSLSLMPIGIDQWFITEKSTKDKENAMKDEIFIA